MIKERNETESNIKDLEIERLKKMLDLQSMEKGKRIAIISDDERHYVINISDMDLEEPPDLTTDDYDDNPNSDFHPRR
jgi:hypothetical protein